MNSYRTMRRVVVVASHYRATFRSFMRIFLAFVALAGVLLRTPVTAHAADSGVFPPGAPVPVGTYPRLTVTAAELTQFKQRAESRPELKAALLEMIAQGEEALNRDVSHLPPKDDDAHYGLSKEVCHLGYAALLSGDMRFAHKEKEIVLRYADAYLTFPCLPEARVFKDSLHEGMWLANMAEACDLLFATDVLSKTEKAHIEKDMLRPAANELMQDRRSTPARRNGHHQCYNFQVIHCAAVGRVGFLLNDARYIAWALGDAPRVEIPPDRQGIIEFGYGFRHLIKHDISDDGLHWERSLGYHFYVAQYMVKLCEAALRNGIDLWHLSVPDDSAQNENGSGNYTHDGNNGPKSAKLLFDGPLYYPFGDLSLAAIADGGGGSLTESAELYELAYRRYNDPHYAWLLQRSYRTRGGLKRRFEGVDTGKLPWNLVETLPEGTPPLPVASPAHIPDLKFGTDGIVRCGSSLFPSSGFAILRARSDAPDGLQALLTYGPYGGGHGHKDKLSLVVYHKGQQIVPALRNAAYEDPLHSDWSTQTVSHNTVGVDGRSQYPQGEWARDTSEHPAMGRLLCFHADPFGQIAQARCDNVVAGVAMERALFLVDGVLLDVFSLRSDQPHTYDWVLHAPGIPQPQRAMTPRATPLGSDQGYQYLTHLETATSANAFTCLFANQGEGVRLTMAEQAAEAKQGQQEPASATEFILGDGPTETLTKTMPTLIARRRGRATTFVSIIRPEADTRPLQCTVTQIRHGLVAIIRLGARETALILGDSKGDIRFHDMQVRAKAALLERKGTRITRISAAGIRSFREGNSTVQRWSAPQDVLLIRDSRGRLRMQCAWQPVRLGGVFIPGSHSTHTRESVR